MNAPATPDRALAEALSAGLNGPAAIRAALSAGAISPAGPEVKWSDSLAELERALDAVIAGKVASSLTAPEEARRQVTFVRELLERWAEQGAPPEELSPAVSALLGGFGLAAR